MMFGVSVHPLLDGNLLTHRYLAHVTSLLSSCLASGHSYKHAEHLGAWTQQYHK